MSTPAASNNALPLSPRITSRPSSSPPSMSSDPLPPNTTSEPLAAKIRSSLPSSGSVVSIRRSRLLPPALSNSAKPLSPTITSAPLSLPTLLPARSVLTKSIPKPPKITSSPSPAKISSSPPVPGTVVRMSMSTPVASNNALPLSPTTTSAKSPNPASITSPPSPPNTTSLPSAAKMKSPAPKPRVSVWMRLSTRFPVLSSTKAADPLSPRITSSPVSLNNFCMFRSMSM